jgi:soluble lytic murein transglycosylase-like protein
MPAFSVTKAIERPPSVFVSRLLQAALCLLVSSGLVLATPATTKSDFEGRLKYSREEIHRAIVFYAKRYRLDSALLRAVIKVESDFRQHVVSRKGAVGLMQLTPDTAATLRVADLYDPIQNIRGGAKQLRRLLNRYRGDLALSLAAYNAGVHRVKGGRVPPIRETKSYVRKVLRYYHRYQDRHLSIRKPESGPRSV